MLAAAGKDGGAAGARLRWREARRAREPSVPYGAPGGGERAGAGGGVCGERAIRWARSGAPEASRGGRDGRATCGTAGGTRWCAGVPASVWLMWGGACS